MNEQNRRHIRLRRSLLVRGAVLIALLAAILLHGGLLDVIVDACIYIPRLSEYQTTMRRIGRGHCRGPLRWWYAPEGIILEVDTPTSVYKVLRHDARTVTAELPFRTVRGTDARVLIVLAQYTFRPLAEWALELRDRDGCVHRLSPWFVDAPQVTTATWLALWRLPISARVDLSKLINAHPDWRWGRLAFADAAISFSDPGQDPPLRR